jgi:iron(III) transport system ATP-binding protein|tara:strand:- start:16726 stop:17787 length:1062 start_codon:yes stop_codon:yes gene_type:complete
MAIQSPPLLEITQLSTSHRKQQILQAINLNIQAQDIVCLLGPSGCGKTTLLRSIAGLHPIDQGSIRLNEKLIGSSQLQAPLQSRGVGMMFQDLALFPHMTIFDNVAYGIRKMEKPYIEKQVRHVLDLVEIPHSGDRKYPHELSGGQQQRVALARSLAPKPSLLLLDEPFSSLDPELRHQLVLEVRKILKLEKITALLVTHDQDEAFSIADSIGVMQQGAMVQFDSPYNIYHEPNSRFVADFVGLGTFIPVEINAAGDVETVFGTLPNSSDNQFTVGSKVDLLVRPDDIPHDDHSQVSAIVEEKRFLGAQFLYTLRLPNDYRVLCYAPSHHDHSIGKPLGIRLDLEHLMLFERE